MDPTTILLAIIAGLAGILTAVGGLYANFRSGQKTVAETDSVEMTTITTASANTVELIQKVMSATIEPLKERLVNAEHEINHLKNVVKYQEGLLQDITTVAETYKMGIILLSNQIVELGHTPVFFLKESHDPQSYGTVHTQTEQRTVSGTTVRQVTTETRDSGDLR
jgi:hypothetical protein